MIYYSKIVNYPTLTDEDLSKWIKELVKDHMLGNPIRLPIMFYPFPELSFI
ncbi:hypothetical protein TSIB_1166 [Thermococcus sibiricus MM 739]|uniref:Uncharacterized protein n=1 Tax=Thermococcus sibiricus (strain DSM 12597 / MM 739) TaxID=604354 RepID=C6A3M5_THESM|nr:hypothetical protein TSIB_1166 [Thermococcus sibiricus MM 739]